MFSSRPSPSRSPSPDQLDSYALEREENAIEEALKESQTDDMEVEEEEPKTNGEIEEEAEEEEEEEEEAAPESDEEYEPEGRTAPKKVTSTSTSAAAARALKQRKSQPKSRWQAPAVTQVDGATGTRMLDALLEKANAYMTTALIGSDPLLSPKKKKAITTTSHKHRRTTEEELDEELLEEFDEADAASRSPQQLVYTQLQKQPPNIVGAMREYQLEGLRWLARLYHSGVSGILADEMGLGKTLQAISLISYLSYFNHTKGPHLVLTPLSTLGNWAREFARWSPNIRVFKFHGTKEERAEMISEGKLKMKDHEVLLTSYEMAIREKSVINKIHWQFIIVDEAHRLKNENSLLSMIVRYFKSRYRLLLTGTPLQNNLHELWALLNFLLPDLFHSSQDFDSIFNQAETDANSDRGRVLLESLSRLLRPFMLRRLKSQVEQDLPPKKESLIMTGLSEIQRKLYKSILEKDLEALMGQCKERSRLMNMVMQLRKVSDHPFLFDGVEDPNAPLHGDHLITTSGKMVVLDKLLTHLKARGSRVLIFSQMTRMLDILEDFCIYRQLQYCRIDGNTAQTDREEMMRLFNADGSERFVFLLSTRAGGLGINLYTADVNPQMDLQAMDRAHRIGQKKQVNVYRFITENTVEEQIIARAEIKLRLDAMVVQAGIKSKSKTGTGALSNEDLTKMIRYGADRIFRQTDSTVSDEQIELILSRGEAKQAEMQSKLKEHVNMLDLSLDGKVNPDSGTLLPGEEVPLELTEEQLKAARLSQLQQNDLGRRVTKRVVYNESDLGSKHAASKNLPKPYRIPKMHDYQFYDRQRIEFLAGKEARFYDKYRDSRFPPQERGINAAEEEELKKLLAEGFVDWTFSDNRKFINAIQRYGRKDLEKIIKSLTPKHSPEEITRYYTTFFQKVTDLKGGAAILSKIERAERRVARAFTYVRTLEKVMATYTTREEALSSLPIFYSPMNKDKGYTVLEDRYLLYATHLYGYGSWKKVILAIQMDPLFYCDWFMLSRSEGECHRRVQVLLNELRRMEEGLKRGQKRKKTESNGTGADKENKDRKDEETKEDSAEGSGDRGRNKGPGRPRGGGRGRGNWGPRVVKTERNTESSTITEGIAKRGRGGKRMKNS